jgi:hypothetical protein
MSTAEALSRAATDDRLAALAAEVADYVAMTIIAIASLPDQPPAARGRGPLAAD